MKTRRAFIRDGALGIGAFVVAPSQLALGASEPPLIEAVATLCQRLGPLGSRQLLFDATDGELDIAVNDLARELNRPLARIDRNFPGFGDFTVAGTRASSLVVPAQPAVSRVGLTDGCGRSPRKGIERLSDTRRDRNGRELCLWRSATNLGGAQAACEGTAARHRGFRAPVSERADGDSRHAELCFARAGVARLGTLEPLYDARTRNFVSLEEARPFDFRVVPRRFAAFLAVQMQGASDEFGPQDPLPQDKNLAFWVPIHKLFSGRECIAGLDLHVELSRGLRNDGLAQFHRFLDLNGF